MLSSMNVLFVGLVVVFLALLLITGLVFLLPVLTRRGTRRGQFPYAAERRSPIPAPIPAPVAVSMTAAGRIPAAMPKRETASRDGKAAASPELISAVIMAAVQTYIAAEPGNEGRTFCIRSVRKAGGAAPVWNLAGRIIQTAGRMQGLS